MKNIIALLVVAVAVGLATFAYVSKQDTAILNQAQAAWAAEKLQLQAEAQKQPERVIVEKTVPNSAAGVVEESAQEILNDLLVLKPGIGIGRNPVLRKVVYKLELLASRGPVALPAIHNFSSKNIDVIYNGLTNEFAATTNSAADNSRRGFGGQRGSVRGEARRARDLTNFGSNWVAPPTLRLGLIGVLKEIGGARAEQELAYMLSTTGRGVEVAYLVVTLEQLAPGKYRDAAVAAAKELLLTPSSADNLDRLDALAKSYLYGVLEFYKDESFVANAQQIQIGRAHV